MSGECEDCGNTQCLCDNTQCLSKEPQRPELDTRKAYRSLKHCAEAFQDYSKALEQRIKELEGERDKISYEMYCHRGAKDMYKSRYAELRKLAEPIAKEFEHGYFDTNIPEHKAIVEALSSKLEESDDQAH